MVPDHFEEGAYFVDEGCVGRGDTDLEVAAVLLFGAKACATEVGAAEENFFTVDDNSFEMTPHALAHHEILHLIQAGIFKVLYERT